MSEQNFNILFSEFLNKHQLKIEGFCALIYCIGLVFMSTKIAGGSAMAGFSLTTLAIVYYLSAFVHPKSGRFVITLSNKVIGVSSAVAIVGILFYSLNLNGGNIMLGVGTTSLAIAALLLAISELFSEEGIQSRVQLIRIALILCFSIYIYLNPPIQ